MDIFLKALKILSVYKLEFWTILNEISIYLLNYLSERKIPTGFATKAKTTKDTSGKPELCS